MYCNKLTIFISKTTHLNFKLTNTVVKIYISHL